MGIQDPQVERVAFFSDAVFAIAITLLVIEIHVPDLPPHTGDIPAINAVLHLIPHFVGFIVSFFVIGAFWAAHHRAFGLVAHFDRAILFPNLRLLMAVAFMPFASGFMSVNVGQRVPVLFYLFSMALVALFQGLLLRRLLREHLLKENVSGELAIVRRRAWSVPIGLCAAVPIAFVQPYLAVVPLLFIPLIAMLLERGVARGR